MNSYNTHGIDAHYMDLHYDKQCTSRKSYVKSQIAVHPPLGG